MGHEKAKEKAFFFACSMQYESSLPDDKMITLNFRLSEILRVDAHFGRQMPILFMNLTLGACARARHALGMREPTTGLWLGSDSKGEL